MNTNDIGRLLAISGPPRSGTTLLSSYFGGHSSINWLPDEGFLFEHLYNLGSENRSLFLDAAALGLDDLVSGIRDRLIMPPTHAPLADFPALEFYWNDEHFRQHLDLSVIDSASNLWEMLVRAYFAGLGMEPRPYVSLKATDYGKTIVAALRTLSRALGIIIVRDPIDALSSLKRYRERGGYKRLTWPTLTATIVEMNALAKTVSLLESEKIFESRFRVIRYEDLVADAPALLLDLLEWMELSFENVVDQPTMIGERWHGNSSFTPGMGIAAPPTERPKALSLQEMDLINKYIGPYAEKFGYKQKTDSTTHPMPNSTKDIALS